MYQKTCRIVFSCRQRGGSSRDGSSRDGFFPLGRLFPGPFFLRPPGLLADQEKVYPPLVEVHLLQFDLHGVSETEDLLGVLTDEGPLLLDKGVVVVARGC